MKTRTIRKAITFKANPHDIYEMLMDSRKHAQVTGSPARISRKVGGKISAWDGYIDGVNLELEPDRKIVQSWRASDWAEGHYSQATFTLSTVEGSTKLSFTQTGVPEDAYEDIRQGWWDYYWMPMKTILKEKG